MIFSFGVHQWVEKEDARKEGVIHGSDTTSLLCALPARTLTRIPTTSGHTISVKFATSRDAANAELQQNSRRY